MSDTYPLQNTADIHRNLLLFKVEPWSKTMLQNERPSQNYIRPVTGKVTHQRNIATESISLCLDGGLS